MNQAGGGNWTHAVSNDLVTWKRVRDALGRGPKNSSWDHSGPSDGTASFPRGSLGPAPVILYGPDCADKQKKTEQPDMVDRVDLGDFPRMGVARPADPTSPFLLDWVKGPVNATFVGPPCSFPVTQHTVPKYQMTCRNILLAIFHKSYALLP